MRARCTCSRKSLCLLPLLFAVAELTARMRLRVSASSFDIMEHLSTKAPYAHRVMIPGAPSLYDVPDPPGYKPVFMYLLARHGSRWPTYKRMMQINNLQYILRLSNNHDLAWMRNWTSPVANLSYLAGELHPAGEAEMIGLAQRLRRRLPGLIGEPYAPRRYPIISTQVPRAAQSASAFALGFFGHPLLKHTQSNQQLQPLQQQQPWQWQHASNGSSLGSRRGPHPAATTSATAGLGAWLPQPVAMSMLPKRHDPVLRFFETCKAYRFHQDRASRWLAPWMHSHWQRLVPSLESRMALPPGSLNTCHVDALWQLCTFEAGLLRDAEASSCYSQQQWGQRGGRKMLQRQQQQYNNTASSKSNCICQLLSQQDAQLLEWLEDVRLYESQGYGAAVNYEIAAPLLADIASALVSAATATAAGRQPLQLARLMFAHCETLTPLATLMGLFKPGAEERRHIPDLPDDQQLKELVSVSSADVDADLAEVDDVAEDLPLVVSQDMQQQQQHSKQQMVAAAINSRVSAAAKLSSSAELGKQQKQEHLTQQQGQRHQQYKRRRLAAAHPSQYLHLVSNGVSSEAIGGTSSSSSQRSDQGSSADSTGSPSGSGSVSAVSIGMEPIRAEPTSTAGSGVSTSSSYSSSSSNSSMSGSCSYKGGTAIDPSLLMSPPKGWLPGFMESDTDRVWRGGRVSPLGANLLLILYVKNDPDKTLAWDSSSSSVSSSILADDSGGFLESALTTANGSVLGDHKVRLVYNEQVVQVPGCSAGLDCSLDEFLRAVVGDKASQAKFDQHCSNEGRSLLMFGTSMQNGVSSSGSSSGGGGICLETADGLPLLLPGLAEQDGFAEFGLWY